MKIFDANISLQVQTFLAEILSKIDSLEIANQTMKANFGILDFFENKEELHLLKKHIFETNTLVEEAERAAYGDFQTNIDLANKVTAYLATQNIAPQIIIEPTCGKGNFLIAALQQFQQIEYLLGIEIYKPYIWETKFNIIHFFLQNPHANKPQISIQHANIFEVNVENIAQKYIHKEVLIIGNPPWVTNSALGTLNIDNLPRKTNFKQLNGLDAITGKGNFDIAEYITVTMLRHFQSIKGHLVFLLKNSVIKNIIFDQKQYKYTLSAFQKYNIDSKREFKVSVEAALFYAKLNQKPAFTCQEYDFYKPQKPFQTYGWLGEKFVSNLETYLFTQEIDGKSPFVWRQGIKHDCANIMELEKVNEQYINALQEKVDLEEALVYGILKSSDLKNTVIHQTRKYTIITQRNVGQETNYIAMQYPKTYQYLITHKAYFDARKSIIYQNKPPFSIFGIGDYSFKPFKVAISGLYKTFHFTLILPQNNKAVMLDDTCYFVGFDKIEFAVFALILLNSEKAKHLLQAITFVDAKRVFTKDILMRIDLLTLAKNIDKPTLTIKLAQLNEKYSFQLTLTLWDNFLQEMAPTHQQQLQIF